VLEECCWRQVFGKDGGKVVRGGAVGLAQRLLSLDFLLFDNFMNCVESVGKFIIQMIPKKPIFLLTYQISIDIIK